MLLGTLLDNAGYFTGTSGNIEVLRDTSSPNLQLLQVPLTGGRLSKQCKWHPLVVNFATSANVTHLMTNFAKPCKWHFLVADFAINASGATW